MGDFVTRAWCSYSVGDEKASEGDIRIVNEESVFVGESPIGKEFFQTLFEGLCRVGVLDFTEDHGIESFVR